jgi:hypothetical protein
MWSSGPEADERRGRVLPAMVKEPAAFPDVVGMGPFGQTDEATRKRVLGLG